MGFLSPDVPDTTTTISETRSDPWEGQQGYLREIFGLAQRNYRDALGDRLPDQLVADVPQATQTAQQNVLRNVAPQQRTLANQALEATRFGLTDVLDVDNPRTQAAITAATRPITENLLEQALPAITSEAVLSGNLGSTRQGVAQGQAIGRAAREVGDVGSRLAYDAYNRGLNTFERTLALAPQAQQMLITPELAADAVGQQQRAYEQELLNQELTRRTFDQDLADVALSRYASLVSGAFGGSTSGSTTAPGQRASPYAPLGGALSGASLGAQIFPGPWGAGIGGALGLLLGFL